MAPSDNKPSPYRFLTPTVTSSPAPSAARKRKNIPPRPSPHPATTPAIPPSSAQFAPTPRFNTTTPIKPSRSSDSLPTKTTSSSPLVSRTLPIYKTPAPLRSGEVVEDTGLSSPSPSRPRQARTGEEDEYDNINTADQSPDSELESFFSSAKAKRRRLSPSPSPPLRPPATPAAQVSSSTTPHTVRPRFILPQSPPSLQEREALIPFSPHKNGRKFVDGGFASTVRGWALEAASEAGRWDDDYAIVSEVQECSRGNGMILVRGVQRKGNSDGLEKSLVYIALPEKEETDLIGKVIGIRKPIWDLDVSGGKDCKPGETRQDHWKVGVDWQTI